MTCLMLACLHATHAHAQYGVDTWTTTEGLPQNGNHSVLQARDGYLWLTTNDGLVRFDGVRVSGLERARVAQEAFSRQLIDSQEGERRRIAAELHDSLGQHLLVIKNRALLGELEGGGGSSVRDQFAQISDAATQSIEVVQHIAYNLRPYHLDRLGLTSAIEDVIERVAAASDIQFASHIEPIDGVIPKAMEINFFRIVEECLNNIIKHSASRHASIRMARRDHMVTITIQDDGKGFDAKGTHHLPVAARGFGMTGIAERVRMLGGRHVITSSPGLGTTIQIDIPVSEPS